MSKNMDAKILTLMINNPDISQKEIAKRLKISPPAVTNRIQRMKKEGIIKGSVPLVNLGKLGYCLSVVIWVRVKNGKLSEAINFFKKEDNVNAVYSVSGDYDLAVFAKFKNSEEVDNWSEYVLGKSELIHKTNTSLIMEAIKERFVPNGIY